MLEDFESKTVEAHSDDIGTEVAMLISELHEQFKDDYREVKIIDISYLVFPVQGAAVKAIIIYALEG